MLHIRATLLLVASVVAAVSYAGCPYTVGKHAVKHYESFTGKELSEEEYQKMEREDKTDFCALSYPPCDPKEGRRVDGTCANLKYPGHGAGRRPFARILPAKFGKDSLIAPTKSGKPRALSKYKRTKLVPEGVIEDQEFTQLLSHVMQMFAADGVNVKDTLNYVHIKPYCCKPEGKNDSECAGYGVPEDDPTLRFTNIRCLNLTVPMSYQSRGCISEDLELEWVNQAPPLVDLSPLYGETFEALMTKGRKFEGGLLKYEVDERGRVWPPAMDEKTTQETCFINSPELGETRCHDSPAAYSNSLLGTNLFSVWFYRQHNLIASELAKRNPCWDDDKLFEIAKDINIALYQQMVYYEVLPTFMGYDNLVRDEVLSSSPGFRDIHDENVIPRMSVEAVYVLRWFHLILHSDLKLYDGFGNYMKHIPLVNMTLRTGLLYQDDNLDGFTQGSFRQPCGKFDGIADPDIVTTGMSSSQEFLDILSNDLQKDGLFGLQPYTHYREFCSSKAYKTFSDLLDVIPPEGIDSLEYVYEDVEDVEILPGLWLEKFVRGGKIPDTMYCILQDQLYKNIASDRHWYERPNRPNAFTEEQLKEVRKSTGAQLLCAVGDSVSEIQPQAYRRAGPGNEMTSCSNIPSINFDAWKDSSC